jgi:hypothetical protein
MDRCLPLLKYRRKLVLSFTNVHPQSFGLIILFDVANNLSRNECKI